MTEGETWRGKELNERSELGERWVWWQINVPAKCNGAQQSNSEMKIRVGPLQFVLNYSQSIMNEPEQDVRSRNRPTAGTTKCWAQWGSKCSFYFNVILRKSLLLQREVDTDDYFCVPKPKVYVKLFKLNFLLEPLRQVCFKFHYCAVQLQMSLTCLFWAVVEKIISW